MDLNLLKYFCVVADRGSISSAAAELHITQPALSRAIMRLEEDIGVPLFTRKGKNIKLNQSGERFLVHVTIALRELSDGKLELQCDENQQINFGVCIAGIIAAPMEKFIDTHPNTHLNQYVMRQHEMLSALRKGEIDFGVFPSAVVESDISFIPLIEDSLMVLCSKKKKLAKKPEYQFADFCEENLLFGDSNIVFRNEICHDFINAGLKPKILYEGAEDDVILSLVEKGIGIFFIPYSVYFFRTKFLKKQYPGIKSVPICQVSGPKKQIGLAMHKDHYQNVNTQHFIKYIQKYYLNVTQATN